MKYLFDTDICVFLIKRKFPALLEKFRRLPAGDMGLSVITVFEMQYGAHRSRFQEQNARTLQLFLAPLTILPFEEEDAKVGGAIRADLEAAGNPIGPFDLLIAAQAIRNGLTVVTNNMREFGRVKGLQVENWAA